MNKRYAVTGGAGFIGANLVHYLKAHGEEVIIVDDMSNGKESRILDQNDLRLVDIRETSRLANVLAGCDTVFHLAALPRVEFSIQNPTLTHDVNVTGTISVLQAARSAGVRRVVYAASSSAYGDHETMPLHEKLPPRPKSPYALQKHMGEGLMRLWTELYGIETISLRFFNVYGKMMDPDGAYALVVGKFIKMRKEGVPLTITGDGEQTRDFTHVTDIIDALIRASESMSVGRGEVFNCGAGRNITVNELARMIGGPTEYIPARIEPRHTLSDTSLIEEVLGWKPRVTIEEGIAELKREFELV